MLWLVLLVLIFQQTYALLVAPLIQLGSPLVQGGWLAWALLAVAIWALAGGDRH
jgi:hypothetical protein